MTLQRGWATRLDQENQTQYHQTILATYSQQANSITHTWSHICFHSVPPVFLHTFIPDEHARWYLVG